MTRRSRPCASSIRPSRCSPTSPMRIACAARRTSRSRSGPSARAISRPLPRSPCPPMPRSRASRCRTSAASSVCARRARASSVTPNARCRRPPRVAPPMESCSCASARSGSRWASSRRRSRPCARRSTRPTRRWPRRRSAGCSPPPTTARAAPPRRSTKRAAPPASTARAPRSKACSSSRPARRNT